VCSRIPPASTAAAQAAGTPVGSTALAAPQAVRASAIACGTWGAGTRTTVAR